MSFAPAQAGLEPQALWEGAPDGEGGPGGGAGETPPEAEGEDLGARAGDAAEHDGDPYPAPGYGLSWAQGREAAEGEAEADERSGPSGPAALGGAEWSADGSVWRWTALDGGLAGEARQGLAHEPQESGGMDEGPAPAGTAGDGIGVEWLYRRAAQAVWQDGPGRTVQAPAVRLEDGPAASALSLEEIDRAVRRDSRRYDGELTIY